MPYVHIHIDFDEFEDEDLIEHLAVCGQTEAARAEALALVSAEIGRPI